MSLLQLEGINTYYGQIHILQDVNIEVREGELVCLLGGNASGKSTTLKTILGIVKPRTGRIEFAGEDVTSRSTRIGASPIDGSSISISLGRDISARAMATICCSPPESVPASCERRSYTSGKVS